MSGTIIQIKRTTGSTVPSGGAERGELVYVYETSNTSDAGSQGGNTKRLFIGDGSGQSLIKVGGEYYTNLLEATHGTLTANKTLIADDNKAIDDLYVGNNSTIGGSIKFNEGTNSNANSTNYVELKASDSLTSSITFRLPVALPGSTGQALVSDTNGNLSFQTVGGLLDINADGSTNDTIDLVDDTLTISGGTGITTSIASNEITISGDDATTTTKGIASFDTNHFTVSTGAVTIKASSIENGDLDNSTISIAGNTGTNDVDLGDTLTIQGGTGTGIATSVSGDVLTVSGVDATTSTKGVASFDTDHFTVSTGAVTIKASSIENDDLDNSTISIAADTGTTNAVDLGDTLTIQSGTGTGITTSVSGDVLTVSGVDATTSTKGVASFATADFGVILGAVSLSDTVVKTLSTDSGAMTISNHGFSVLGGEGIDVTHTGTSISVVGEDATDTNKGIAKFDSADFSVSTGNVTIKTGGVSNTQLANNSITFGATAVALGSTVSSFSDVTTITTTNGADLTISPAGDLVLNSTGDIDANNNNIINVATPINANDAANKEYVDAVAEGLHIHASVEVATTAALTGTYSNGTSGIGATFTLTSPIAVSTGIDGFTDAAHLVTGARILIKNQSNDFENGIYTMNVSGSAGSEQIDSFTRADDFNTPTEVAGGDFVFVIHGTNYANTGWVQTEHVDTIGTDTVSFSQFSGAGTFLAGNGLTLTGNTFDVVGTANRITVSANDIDIASTYVGQTSITTLGTIATGTWNADVIGPVYGGTGLSSYTTGDLLYASGTNTLSALAAGTNGYILYSNNGTPAWLSAIDLTTQVTGTLPVANGGTGATTFTSNGILYGNGTNALQVTAAGTDGYILYSNNGTPEWTDVIDGGTYT